MGRGFSASDDRPGAEPTILLSESLWQDLFDGDGTVVGRSVRLDGVAHRVIGVMPHGFSTGPARMWLPARQALVTEDRLDRTRRARNLVMARLAPGASIAQADDEMQAIATRQEEQHPDANRDLRVNVVPLERWMTGEFAAPVQLLLGVVLFVC